MKPSSSGSSGGLILTIIVLAAGWIAIVWVTRRMKRDMEAGDKP